MIQYSPENFIYRQWCNFMQTSLRFSDLSFQVNLHKTDETPQKQNLGFAVQPGIHSLVSVDYSTVSSKYYDQPLRNHIMNFYWTRVMYLHSSGLQPWNKGLSISIWQNYLLDTLNHVYN